MTTQDYSKFKVAELKELVKERGIAGTGLTRKQQYIDALEADDAKAGDDAEEVANGGDDEAVEQQEAIENVDEADTVAVETVLETEPAAAPTQQEPIAPEADKAVSREPSRPTTPDKATETPDASSETRKRKRRSPTPAVQEQDVNKKLKTAEAEAEAEPEPDTHTEDAVVEDAPAPVDQPAEVLQQYGSSDDVMMDVQRDEPASDMPAMSNTEPTSEALPPPDAAGDVEEEGGVTGAIHPATRALYIRELIRPLQANQLHAHLVELATAPGEASDASAIETCHLDTMRTHAFVMFTSINAASRARSRLHDTVWPDEPTRKPLWVDFVPSDKALEWIELEQADGRDRRNAKRWEVVYNTDTSSGEVVASLEEVKQGAQPGGRSQSTQANTATAPPAAARSFDAPTGPRADRRPSTHQDADRRPSDTMPPPRRRVTQSPVETRRQPKQSAESFNVLDQRFTFTTAKPKLYFQPVSADMAGDRLRELERTTSRDWEEVRRRPLGGVDGQLRRYTFEDGDKLVDGGPDRGSFGVPEGYFRGGGGGGGRGGRSRRGRGGW